ncbi:hypothetical protein D3C76_754370 [compost metagenome]
MHDHLQGVAQVFLVGEQQAHFAEVRQLALLGHAQAEAFTTTQGRGGLQQIGSGAGRNALFGIAQQRKVQAHLGQQGIGVQSQMASHFHVIDQYGGSGKTGHDGQLFHGVKKDISQTQAPAFYRGLVGK